MLRASTFLLRRDVVSMSYRTVRVNVLATGTALPSSFYAPLVSCVRQSSTGWRLSRWDSSRNALSWRQKPVSSPGALAKGKKKLGRRAIPQLQVQPKATKVKTRRAACGKGQQKRLSAHQRQAKKYNKRVEAIARLWKEQRQQQQQQQGVGKRPKNILAPRAK
ncbi:hypothetical protein JKF63_00898 [Porcisia hertigi]|uniref:Uncharacterized protein n=1 Tax=Porcisia hertigi TaxID=2761500 RepID=A0A836KXH4_9TRYP|nr:hypothetical protein JKF63_00898 [Porcisia hertigi]